MANLLIAIMTGFTTDAIYVRNCLIAKRCQQKILTAMVWAILVTIVRPFPIRIRKTDLRGTNPKVSYRFIFLCPYNWRIFLWRHPVSRAILITG